MKTFRKRRVQKRPKKSVNRRRQSRKSSRKMGRKSSRRPRKSVSQRGGKYPIPFEKVLLTTIDDEFWGMWLSSLKSKYWNGHEVSRDFKVNVLRLYYETVKRYGGDLENAKQSLASKLIE